MKRFNKITKVFLAFLMVFGLLVVDAGVYATEVGKDSQVTELQTTSTTFKNFELTKLDSAQNNKIQGAVFAFSTNKDNLTKYLTTKKNDSKWYGDNRVIEVATSPNGIIQGWLTPGTWYFAETKAAPGFILDPTIQEVKTTRTTLQKTTIKNTSYGKLEIIKQNPSGTNLSGAEFKLLFVENGVEKVVIENVIVNEKQTFDHLIPGTYKIIETKAPDGYDLDSTPITIEVEAFTKNNKVTIVTVTNTPTPPKYGFLVITKYNIGKEIALPGADFGVYTDSECTHAVAGTPFTTGTDGKTVTITLLPGTYYVKELKAPAGYQLDQTPVSVSITVGTTTNYDMQNNETPPTAGNYASTLLIGLLLAAFTAISYGCFKFAKKHVNR